MSKKTKGIKRLQSQLISDILKDRCEDVRNIDDGINTIKKTLSNKRVLLLFDDLYEKKHMDALVGPRNWLGEGSKLIITTRNKDTLVALGVDDCYELTGMDHGQSLKLFSKHAFKRDSPLDEYFHQSNKVIDIAGGLSLALEVMGSLLYGAKKEMWDARLKMLESVPHDKIQSTLKISCDALAPRQKDIFLDIACLFIGYDKDILVHFWDESDFFSKVAMEDLQNMSLIKINEDNEVWMHDLLRDFRREMVRQESGKKIVKQNRVWDPNVGSDLLRKHKVMKNLKVLNLSDCCSLQRLPDELGRDLARLEYLSLNGCRLLERLLDLIENMELLIELDISWTRIKELPDSIGKLKNLKRLKMMWCHNIRKIPDALWTIEKLKEINVFGDFGFSTNIHQIHVNIGNCIYKNQSLRILNLGGAEIYAVPKLPESLVTLDLHELYMDTFLDLSNLTNLKELRLSFRSRDSREESGGPLEECLIPRSSKLESLYIACCPNNLRHLPRLPSSLSSLHLEFCNSLCSMEDLDLSSPHLKELRLFWCPNLRRLPRLPSSLSSLYLDECPSLCSLEFVDLSSTHVTTSPTDLTLPSQLKELRLSVCPNLCHLPRLPSSLSYLSLIGCNSIRSMEDLDLSTPQLKELHLKYCPSLRCLPRLPSSLHSLDLSSCKSLCSMGNLSNLKNLSSLSIVDAAIEETQGPGCLENLQVLELSKLEQVKILPDLSKLNKLRSFRVRNSHNLVEIQGELPQSLEELRISSCKSLQKLPDLSSLNGLQMVTITHCMKLNVEAISSLCLEKSVKSEGEDECGMERRRVFNVMGEMPNLNLNMREETDG